MSIIIIKENTILITFYKPVESYFELNLRLKIVKMLYQWEHL